jgi:hypothetical protein
MLTGDVASEEIGLWLPSRKKRYSTLKLYNDQRNAQVFNLFIYLLLPYMFRAFF